MGLMKWNARLGLIDEWNGWMNGRMDCKMYLDVLERAWPCFDYRNVGV